MITPIIVVDAASVIFTSIFIIVLVDWIRSGKKYFGEYVDYRNISTPIAWFILIGVPIGVAVFLGCSLIMRLI